MKTENATIYVLGHLHAQCAGVWRICIFIWTKIPLPLLAGGPNVSSPSSVLSLVLLMDTTRVSAYGWSNPPRDRRHWREQRQLLQQVVHPLHSRPKEARHAVPGSGGQGQAGRAVGTEAAPVQHSRESTPRPWACGAA